MEKQAHTIDNDTGAITSVAIKEYKIVDKDGDGYFITDIMEEAVNTAKLVGVADKAKANLSAHMVQMAKLCGNAATFRALCEMGETTKKWGRAPKGTPQHIAKLYVPMPEVWSQYKSRLISALEAGIKPEGEHTYKVANRKGELETKKIVLDSVSRMDKARRDTVAPSKPKADNKGGVVVTKSGDQQLHEVTKGVPLELQGILSDIASLFPTATTEAQAKAKKALFSLRGRLEAAQKEVKQAAAKVANS